MTFAVPLALCRAAIALADDGHDVDPEAIGHLALAPGAASRTTTEWIALFHALRGACTSPSADAAPPLDTKMGCVEAAVVPRRAGT